jgi:DNA/RNA endonuclease YhcR with UshA esterase domain
MLAAVAQDKKPEEAKKAPPQKISATEADKHYQETLIVTGKVAQVTLREKLVYINLEKRFPETPFTGVIFARATNQFGNLKSLEGKQVELTGRIEEYRDKPQIVLNSTNQLKVIDQAN